MKSVLHIFLMVLCSVPFYRTEAAPVATTAGDNLTAFYPNNANNNQWASLANGRSENKNASTQKADFGNCNSVVLRCAQPKCSNGGCTDMSIAAAIVKGCVQSNEACKKYGDDLVSYMSAQLVASSVAKINTVNAAAQDQALQSANAVAQQSQQAMMQMQSQMVQMQQQMAEQNANTAAQIEAALAQQQQQTQQALTEMVSMSDKSDEQQPDDSFVTKEQQTAIDKGVSNDILLREQIGGQIITSIDDAKISLKEAKTAMLDAFDYAGCDEDGNDCEAPTRVKSFRSKASKFFEPYNNTVDKIYDALITAQTVGIDLTDIYLMLNDACNSWGTYICPVGEVSYPENAAPCVYAGSYIYTQEDTEDKKPKVEKTWKRNDGAKCQPCQLVKVISSTDTDSVYEGWINSSQTSDDNQTVVACASNALNTSKIFARRSKSKNGLGILDIDKLEVLVKQKEPSSAKKDGGTRKVDDHLKYCSAKDAKEQDILHSVVRNKKTDNKVCSSTLGVYTKETNEDDCTYISEVYGLCDTHAYNIGETTNPTDYSKKEEMNEVIALKTTVIAQQMNKQYEYLEATLRRLRTQLEKSVLSAQLAAAGASSSEDVSSSSKKKSVFVNCSGKNRSETVYCLRSNYQQMLAVYEKSPKSKDLQKAIISDARTIKGFADKTVQDSMTLCMNAENLKDKDKILTCLSDMSAAINLIEEGGNQQRKSYKLDNE